MQINCRSILPLALLLASVDVSKQVISVSGKLTCGNQSLHDANVSIINRRKSVRILDQAMASVDGTFELVVTFPPFLSLSPELVVTHNCNDRLKVGRRLTRFGIPRTHLQENNAGHHVLNIGTINLEMHVVGEEVVSTRRTRYQRQSSVRRHCNYDMEF